METSDQIVKMAAWLGRALGESASFFADFAPESLGVKLPDALLEAGPVQNALSAAQQSAGQMEVATTDLENAVAANDRAEIIKVLIKISTELKDYFQKILQLVEAIDQQINQHIASGADRDAAKAFAGSLARQVFDKALLDLLEKTVPQYLFVLKMLGLAEWRLVEATGADNISRTYVEKALYLERVKDLITDPALHLQQSFGWGSNDFDPASFFHLYRDFFDEEADITIGEESGHPYIQHGRVLIKRIPAANGHGLSFGLAVAIEESEETRIPFNDTFGFSFLTRFALAGELALQLEPPFDFSFVPPGGELSGDLRLFFNRNEEARPFGIIENNDLISFTVDDTLFGVGLALKWDSGSGKAFFDPLIFAEIKRAVLKIGSAGSDSFIADLLGSAEIQGLFDLGLEWSHSGGLRVKASGGIEIMLPIHKDLGVVTINVIYIALRIRENGTLALETSAGFTGKLGPFAATVERIGTKLDLRFTDGDDAESGAFDLDFGFKPPNGIGLVINASAVKGGGYLFLDHEKGEYAGVAELTIKELVSLKAIGIVNTKLPDGRPGFAFLLIISAEFTPIQLGFGFTLNGVGGLIGINRGLFVNALAEGVKNGTIDNIMFPEDPVANAPQIIANMNAFFPIEEGTYTFGFMGIIGWGTPTLVRVELGLIIQVPDPVVFAILGVIKVALPTEEAAIVKLQVNFLGVIHFEERYMFFFAGLFGSKIVSFTLSGEMYFSIDWSDNPNFVFSVGGFHPDFNSPALRGGIGQLQRISLNLLGGNNPRLTLSFYFAVTSNTVQFGASVDFLFKVWKVRVVGYLFFDALFQFNPFYFKITIGAGLAVMWGSRELFGIHLKGSLEGPTPWRIKGKASFRILFVKIKVRVNKTFGKEDLSVLPPVEIKPILLEALQDQRNWQAELPPASSLLVSLRQLVEEGEEAPLIAHPYGMLAVSQSKLPLNLDLEKMGEDRPSDFKAFRLKLKDSLSPTKVEDFFAPAQYLQLSGEEKLSRKSFEKFASGVRAMGDDGFKTFDYIEKCYEYERCIIDTRLKEALEEEELGLIGEEESYFDTFVNGGAVAKSTMGRAAKASLAVDVTKKIKVGEETFILVRAKDLVPLKKGGSNVIFATETAAYQKLKAMIKKYPELKGQVKVVSEFELV